MMFVSLNFPIWTIVGGRTISMVIRMKSSNVGPANLLNECFLMTEVVYLIDQSPREEPQSSLYDHTNPNLTLKHAYDQSFQIHIQSASCYSKLNAVEPVSTQYHL